MNQGNQPCLLQKQDETPCAAWFKVIALPYHIPGGISEKKLLDLENKCIDHIHARFLTAIMCGHKIGAILLELILAGSGAELSDPFLKRFGILCKTFGCYDIVDEIFTGGRTTSSSFALTMTKPNEFIDAVSHLVFGKWLGLGLVLAKKHIINPYRAFRNNYGQTMERGSSSDLHTREALERYLKQKEHRRYIEERSLQVLGTLRLSEEKCWGKGLMIFGPFSCNLAGRQSIKNRLSPLLQDKHLICKRADLAFKERPDLDKEKLTGSMVEAIQTWLRCPPYPSLFTISYHYMTTYVVGKKTGMFSSMEVRDFIDKEINKNEHALDLRFEIVCSEHSRHSKRPKLTRQDVKISAIDLNIQSFRAMHLNDMLKKTRTRSLNGKRPTYWKLKQPYN